MSNPAILPADIEALADSFSGSADALHRRIMRAIAGNAAQDGDALSHAEAQALFDQEVALRQHANRLYAEAAHYAASAAALPIRDLLALATSARDRIRRIDRIRNAAGIAAALLSTAAAIAARRPEGLPKALEDLKAHLEALHDAKDG